MDQHFDLITIGGGSGGVSASRRAASHGAKVALIEKSRFGGTCVNRGCIPKKLLMYASQFRETLDIADAFGWQVDSGGVDMAQWQDAKSAEIDRLESVYRDLLQQSKVKVVDGVAEILGPKRVRVAGRELTCERLLIATGGQPSRLGIPGLDSALTSDDILDLRFVPKRLAVIGAGYIGIEFASMFARLGSEVSVFFRDHHPLRGFDQDIRVRLSAGLEQAGVQLFAQTQVESVTKTKEGYLLRIERQVEEIAFDAVLNATGRIPNAFNLGLENIGLSLTTRAVIPVNSYSQTAIPNVYAVGDVTNRTKLTPVAIAEGRAFADTVYGGLDIPFYDDQVATAVFTDPAIATVGLSEVQAAAIGPILVFATQFRPMVSAFAKRKSYSYMKLVVDADTDRVLGIHMIGPDAPEIIQSLAVALRANVTKRQFDQTIAVHPTTAEEFVLMHEPVRRVPA
jgi:glutathione reductase (NADPH)